MCDHTNDPGGREAAMTVIRRDEKGTPTVWCDPCLAPIVTALNAAGIATIASCCGHGKNDSSIALADGRWLTFGSEPPIAYEHRIEPQGEPSDAMIDAALKAWGHYKWVGLPTSNQVAMRAALRAALRAAGGVR